MAGGWPASKTGIPGYSEGICWLLVGIYIYTLHVYMIPARRKQLSVNFTTLLILSLFPYRTWDLHGIQATTLQPLAHWSVLKNYNDYLLYQHKPTPTYHEHNNSTGKHVHPHHPPRRLRLPPLNLPRPRIPRFELRNLSPRQSNSYRLRPVRLFFPLPSLPLQPPPTNTSFFFPYLDVSAAATISAPNLAKNSPYQNATASPTKS